METKWSVIIEILERLADPQFQKEIWIERMHQHPLFSYGEIVNTLGDYSFFDSIRNHELNLTSLQYEMLNRYIEELLAYEEPQDSSLLLDDVKWQEIIESTREVINVLKANAPPDFNNLKDFYSYNNH